MKQDTEIQRNEYFAVHDLNELGIEKASAIRDSFDTLLNILNDFCIECAEFTICKRKLEESCFYAKKAMAINLTNQKI